MDYALFLRGVNLGGIKVPMKELGTLLTKQGLDRVKTYLQTGNVSFSSPKPVAELKPELERALSQHFNYSAFVLLFTLEELRQVVAAYPFAAEKERHRYILFCASQEVADELTDNPASFDPKVEKVAAGKRVVYWQVPIGQTTDTIFSQHIARPRYKTVTTNRNLNTLEKMLEN